MNQDETDTNARLIHAQEGGGLAASRRTIAAGILSLGVLGLGLLFVAGPLKRLFVSPPPLTPLLGLVSRGRFVEAEAPLDQYLEYDPGNVSARLALAEALLGTAGPSEATAPREPLGKRANKALAVLSQAQSSDPRASAVIRVLQGKAYFELHRLGDAEEAWNAALRFDRFVGEAGWLLLQLYYYEGREDESRGLALRLAEIEPDQRDRARLLLEPARYDAEPMAAAGVIAALEPAIRADSSHNVALAYYRASARDGKNIDRSLAALRAIVDRNPHDLVSWDTYLDTLAEAGDLEGIGQALGKVPSDLANHPRLARHYGRWRLENKDYDGAARRLREAVAFRPADAKSLHRLATALKFAGKAEEADTIKVREAEYEAARVVLRGIKATNGVEAVAGLFENTMNRRDFGVHPNPELDKKIATVRERMGHADEALAWHKHVLESSPSDAESLAAVARLTKVLQRQP